jgi:3-hydroxyacyl-[acyl-carrier-protein] dehydratase
MSARKDAGREPTRRSRGASARDEELRRARVKAKARRDRDREHPDPATVLRHRPPLLLVDRVTSTSPGRWLVAEWTPNRRWPIFRGHFPGEPIVPGVLLVEAIAQASGILAWATAHFDPEAARMYLMTVERARFRTPARPGDLLEIRTDLVDRRDPLWRFDGSITAHGEIVCDTRLVAALLVDPARPGPGQGAGK